MVRVFVACAGDSSDVLGYYYLALTAYRIKKDDVEGSDGVHLDAAFGEKFGRVEAAQALRSSDTPLGMSRCLQRTIAFTPGQTTVRPASSDDDALQPEMMTLA
jgi:hypothetical protein